MTPPVQPQCHHRHWQSGSAGRTWMSPIWKWSCEQQQEEVYKDDEADVEEAAVEEP